MMTIEVILKMIVKMTIEIESFRTSRYGNQVYLTRKLISLIFFIFEP